MRTYLPFQSDVEVHGGYMLSFVECINKQDVLPSLKKLGISDIDPNAWYEQHLWMDIFNDLIARLKGTAFPTFVSIGMKLAEVPFPPELANASYPQFMRQLSGIYDSAHRGGYPGAYEVEIISDNHVQLTARVPYPDDFIYGIQYGFAKRFLPKGTNFNVRYDDQSQRADEGGEYTIFHITWK